MVQRRVRPASNGRADTAGRSPQAALEGRSIFRPTRRPLIHALILTVPAALALGYFSLTRPSSDYFAFYLLLALMVGLVVYLYLARPGVTVILDASGIAGIQGRTRVQCPWTHVLVVREHVIPSVRRADRVLVVEG